MFSAEVLHLSLACAAKTQQQVCMMCYVAIDSRPPDLSCHSRTSERSTRSGTSRRTTRCGKGTHETVLSFWHLFRFCRGFLHMAH